MAIATGSKSARITPADGLAFFTSAISLIGPPAASGVKEIAHRRRIGQPRTQLLLRPRRLRPLDLGPLRGDNLVENRHASMSLLLLLLLLLRSHDARTTTAGHRRPGSGSSSARQSQPALAPAPRRCAPAGRAPCPAAACGRCSETARPCCLPDRRPRESRTPSPAAPCDTRMPRRSSSAQIVSASAATFTAAWPYDVGDGCGSILRNTAACAVPLQVPRPELQAARRTPPPGG